MRMSRLLWTGENAEILQRLSLIVSVNEAGGGACLPEYMTEQTSKLHKSSFGIMCIELTF